MSNFNYKSQKAKLYVLPKINKAEEKIRDIRKLIKAIDIQLNSATLDIVYARTVMFGPGKGKTGARRK